MSTDARSGEALHDFLRSRLITSVHGSLVRRQEWRHTARAGESTVNILGLPWSAKAAVMILIVGKRACFMFNLPTVEARAWQLCHTEDRLKDDIRNVQKGILLL